MTGEISSFFFWCFRNFDYLCNRIEICKTFLFAHSRLELRPQKVKEQNQSSKKLALYGAGSPIDD